MDDHIDASENEPKQEPAPLPLEPVEVVAFPNLQNLQPLMPKEIQYDDMIDYLHEPKNEPEQIHQGNIQVGFAQFFQPEAEAAFSSWINQSSMLKPNPEAIRQWVRHFSHHSGNVPTVIILDSWMNFFTFMLLQSPSFEWAKSFLQSPA